MRTSLLSCLLVLLVGPVARIPAQSLFLYASNELGRTFANAYPLDKLKASDSQTNDETWYDLFVKGPDRWLIRGDGKIALNGKVIDDLADDDGWRGIVVDEAGDFVALRKGGKVSGPKGVITNYTGEQFSYLDIVTDGVSVYILRTNGGVFRVPEPDALIKFNGPPGEVDGATGDGEASDTVWEHMAINPADGTMWALRRDGTLKSAPIPLVAPVDPDPGTLMADLPYDDGDGVIHADELYADIAFDTDGTWYVLRNDGKLYTEEFQGPPTGPLVDLPGDPSDDSEQTYRTILAFEGQTFALRDDGKVFRNVETTAVIDLKGTDYNRLALGDTLPNLENVKNQPPIGTSYSITAPEGSNIELPVLATDRDKPSEDLVVDVDLETLPAGATWDADARVITWPAAGPKGTYKIKVTIDDGIAKPVNAMQTIKIQTPDTNENKNIKPVLAKVKNAVALVGIPFALPILAFDRDGTIPTVTLDLDGKPVPVGVTFDEVEDVLNWPDPDVADKGTFTFYFLVDDGTAQPRIGRKVKVDTSLLAF